MNRRSEPRFDVYYRARIVPVEHPENPVDASLIDISGGGMRLVTSQELPEDQVICVEVGQHLVLAEVRSSIPRGSRYLIGAEKIHTLNLLTLPESMGNQDRIQALVDDYHLRLQFEIESQSQRNGEGDTPAAPAREPKLPDMINLESPPVEPHVPPPLAVALAVAAEPDGTSEVEPPAADLAPLPATPVEGPVESPSSTAPQPAVQDPGMASALRSDPAPVAIPLVPVSAAVEVDFGHLRIVLPETRGIEPEIGPEAVDATDVEHTQPLVSVEAPVALALEPVPEALAPEPPAAEHTEAKVKARPDLTPPAQPIWMAPPGGPPLNGDAPADPDPLRAMAIQGDLARIAEPEPRDHSRTIAALAAALVAVVALVALLFGPIRNRLSLSPAASASEKSAKKAPGNPSTDKAPKDLVIQVDSTGSTQAVMKSTPMPATPPASVPKPAKTPAAAAKGSGVHVTSVRTSAPSWIWACADGKPMAGRVLPGGTDLEIEFSREAWVLIGNAGAVQMNLDGNPLGPLGPEGTARAIGLTPKGFHVAASVGSRDCGNP